MQAQCLDLTAGQSIQLKARIHFLSVLWSAAGGWLRRRQFLANAEAADRKLAWGEALERGAHLGVALIRISPRCFLFRKSTLKRKALSAATAAQTTLPPARAVLTSRRTESSKSDYLGPGSPRRSLDIKWMSQTTSGLKRLSPWTWIARKVLPMAIRTGHRRSKPMSWPQNGSLSPLSPPFLAPTHSITQAGGTKCLKAPIWLSYHPTGAANGKSPIMLLQVSSFEFGPR